MIDQVIVVVLAFSVAAAAIYALHLTHRRQHELILLLSNQLDDSRKLFASRDYRDFSSSKTVEAGAAQARTIVRPPTDAEIEKALWQAGQNTPDSTLDPS
jgi:hypothetical protein